MKRNKPVNCPICNFDRAQNLLELNCGNLDNSTLYQSVKINGCEKCGHIYNKLSPNEIANLKKYYNEEYAPTNFGSPDKTGDRPGSNNINNFGRYDQIYNLVSKYIKKDFRVLDVGCAMGGFLDYLQLKGLKKLSGIDPVAKYVETAKENNTHDIRVGVAESIPFTDKVFDLIIMDQVMEHLVNPIYAFREAKRVLTNGGLLCLGVPDAMRYNKNYFFDFYWFIMREHIQHFDTEHLKLLASQEGFELISFNESNTPMMSEKMILPNLNIVFRLTNQKSDLNISENCFKLKKEIEQYVINDLSKLNNKKKVINDLIISQKPLYAWGIGREFLYLYEMAGLKKCNLVGLIDSNPYKQEVYTVNGKKILGQNILTQITHDSTMVITAMAHIDTIKILLKETGFNGEIVEL
jgi:SAM-dependent methyltransferase